MPKAPLSDEKDFSAFVDQLVCAIKAHDRKFLAGVYDFAKASSFKWEPFLKQLEVVGEAFGKEKPKTRCMEGVCYLTLPSGPAMFELSFEKKGGAWVSAMPGPSKQQ